MAEKREGVDRINPAHYGGLDNPYEVIKVLEDWLSPEELIGAMKFNVIKYLARAGKHVAGEADIQDAKKARWYLDRMIQNMERRSK